ncbi:MAG TPA: FAD-dependent oxidoreductase, partial [Saprospiraceae bacterium]|nr:FAD-dependent oxidoreductase [Saprospiraceae bacterium]
MQNNNMTSSNGSPASITPETLETFRSGLRGTLVTPESLDYDTARTIWNAMVDKRPAMIVRCAGTADVIHAVRFAKEHHLLVAVKGAGHNIAGNAMCNDGLVIDLSSMKSVYVDPVTRRARTEPGATLRDFDHETQAFGLAIPLGINSTTGIAGLTLGGGFGWLTRQFGATVDSLISADVVTHEGKLVHTSENENADLFWGIRGGGGNFGIVTSFEYQLLAVGPEIYAGLIVFPFDQARSLLKQYRDLATRMPEEANTWIVLRKAPPLPFLPE